MGRARSQHLQFFNISGHIPSSANQGTHQNRSPITTNLISSDHGLGLRLAAKLAKSLPRVTSKMQSLIRKPRRNFPVVAQLRALNGTSTHLAQPIHPTLSGAAFMVLPQNRISELPHLKKHIKPKLKG
eukprot:4805084-Amphidinium_carterae.1